MKLFSKREIRECNEQNPLHLYLYVSSSGTDTAKLAGLTASGKIARPGSLTLTNPIRTRTELPIALTQDILTPLLVESCLFFWIIFDCVVDMVQLIMSQLSIQTSKESQEETDEFKKIITDMTNVVASIAKDIVPEVAEQDVHIFFLSIVYLTVFVAIVNPHAAGDIP